MQHGHGLGAQSHRAVMPIDQGDQHPFFTRGKRPTATGIDERIEEDAIFNPGLAVTDALESLVVESNEGAKGRG